MCPTDSLTVPARWGLRSDLIDGLADQLWACWQRFRPCFRTKTRDTSQYAYHYLSGQLRMTTNRTFAGIARTAGIPSENLQHFMSNAPWDARAVFRQIQQDIAATPGLATGGILILDESAVAKAGTTSAGAGRQWNGRLGKIDLSQVGVQLAFAHGHTLWTWVDGDLFLPEHWFTPAYAEHRARAGVPPERTFATKVDLGWQLIQQAQANGLPFDLLACDDLYGRVQQFRQHLQEAGITYAADIPANTEVFLDPADAARPLPPRDPTTPKGRRVPHPGVWQVRDVARRPDTDWVKLTVRPTERGLLTNRFAARRVWTRRDGGQLAEEWLVMREEGPHTISYLLSNATADTPLARLAWIKCQRYAIETANQVAKTDLGWDELQAHQYRAWEHHLALTILASWFVAQTKWTWQQQAPPDPDVRVALGVDHLPGLSVANVRELLRAVMPLPQLSPNRPRRW